MSEALAVPSREPIALPARLLRLLPGIALLTVIGYAGKLTEAGLRDYGKAHHMAMPNLEYVLWAIVFGLVISNTVGVANVFKPGIATYDFWLKVGIVLLGARFLLGDVAKLGGVSLVLVAIELVAAAAVMTVIGKWFKLKPGWRPGSRLPRRLAARLSRSAAAPRSAARASAARRVGGPRHGP